MEGIPLLVDALSGTSTLNPNVSDSVHHWTPMALTVGRASSLKSKSFISAALSFSGIHERTHLLLVTYFVRLNPLLKHKAFRDCKSAMPSFLMPQLSSSRPCKNFSQLFLQLQLLSYYFFLLLSFSRQNRHSMGRK